MYCQISFTLLAVLAAACHAHVRQLFYQPQQLRVAAPYATYPAAPVAAPNYVYLTQTAVPQYIPTSAQPVYRYTPVVPVRGVPQRGAPQPGYAVVSANGVQTVVPLNSLYIYREEGAEGGSTGGYFESFINTINHYWPWGQTENKPAEPEAGAAEGGAAETAEGADGSKGKPEKVEAGAFQAAEEQPEAGGAPMPEAEKPEAGKPAMPLEQRFLVVGEPQQFFGQFPKTNPASLQTANNGAVSSYLLLRNQPQSALEPAAVLPQQTIYQPQQVRRSRK